MKARKNLLLTLIFLANSALLIYLLSLKKDKRKSPPENQIKSEVQKPKNASPTPKAFDQKPAPSPKKTQPPNLLEEFETRAREIEETLPLKQDLQNLEEGQVHHIPEHLLKTGRELGKLSEYSLKYPENEPLQEKVKEFYESCAQNDLYPTSIRSLCLFNRMQIAKNRREKFDIRPYPREIKDLVLELKPY